MTPTQTFYFQYAVSLGTIYTSCSNGVLLDQCVSDLLARGATISAIKIEVIFGGRTTA